MEGKEGPRRGLIALLLLGVVALAAALWVPRWLENRHFREAEAIAGVGASVHEGGLTTARKAIESGVSGEAVRAALGAPSFSAATEGTSRHDIWTYYYADGTLTVNLTDGYVVRISAVYRPPNIPTSRRPRDR